MKRRSFLAALGLAPAAPVLERRSFLAALGLAPAAPVLAKLPVPEIPPPVIEPITKVSRNSLLTPAQFTKEALRILHKELDLQAVMKNPLLFSGEDRVIIRRET